MLYDALSNPEFWKYVSIPFVAALVGWSTNWAAVQMLFHPVKPLGQPPFLGWQGILPAKADKMGRVTSQTVLEKLGNLREIFASMEPDRIAAYLVQKIEPRVPRYVEEVMLEQKPEIWEMLPDIARATIAEIVRRELPHAIHDMMREITSGIDDMIDVEEAVVNKMREDPRVINEIFQRCGAREFEFIVHSGIYFGFAFGLVQMTVWFFFPTWWVLPLFGALVGYCTNWMALRVIFQPLRPIRIGPFTLQGLFLKRQEEVAEAWSYIVARRVLTVRNVIDTLLYGSKAAYTEEVIRRHIRHVVDEAVGSTKPIIQMAVGVRGFLNIKESASAKAIEFTAGAFDDPVFNEQQAQKVEHLLSTRIEQLSSEEFQYLLRPAFEEEEIKLVLVGGALGYTAGLAQLAFVFGGL